MAIITLLAAALLPPVFEVGARSRKVADTLALRWHHAQLLRFEGMHGSFPRQAGHKFVLAPWVLGVVEHTRANRDRYFSAALGEDAHVLDLEEKSVDDIWPDFASLCSADTHFAGRGPEGRRHLTSGREILMATDNEGGNVYRDGSVLMLFGDGTVTELPRVPGQLEFGAPADLKLEFCLLVGADSPHPDLRKLRY
jgi:hypothetical protein